jgi:leucyl-tRNA synthetase
MIFCQKCGWQPVPEEDLPVLLPYVKDFQPLGEGKTPLEKASKDWREVKCPNCGKLAERSTEVSDTFLDSSWYFLAYPNLKTEEWSGKSPFNLELTKKWLPVDAYIGGAEHAVLHLLYSRFVWMALSDWGFIPKELGDEPFPFLFSHGLIIKDGAKMSKSRGNVVNPDEYISRFGADALRMYLMFLGPYDQGGDFRDTGMAGMYRFLERVFKKFQISDFKIKNSDNEIKRVLNKTIKKVTGDIAKFKYNTAIAALMEFMNAWEGKGREQRIENREQEKLGKILSKETPSYDLIKICT